MRGEEIAYLGVNAEGREDVHFVSVFGYPSGEPLVLERPRDVTRVLLRPRSMQGFVGGLFWLDALYERGMDPDLVLPFVPGARQDRMNDEGDALFTAKSVAGMINARRCSTVTILDPHSEVIASLVDRCRVIHAHECIRVANEYDAVVSPDAGAEKRAGAVARKLKLPLVHGWKTRDLETGKISGFGLEETPHGRVLVVDDICDGGGTFLGLSDLFTERGITADLYVTHGLFSQGTGKLLNRYRKVFCTDSIAADRPGVEINQVCQRILEGRNI